LCFNYHIPQPNQPNPASLVMPTAADIAIAKNALREKMLKEMEALERAEEEQRRKEEAEKKAEEERIRKALEEAEEAKRKQAEIDKFAQRERELREERQRKVEAKERAEAEKKSESEKKAEGKKRGREDSVGVTVGAILVEDGVTWYVREGQVCEGCVKAEEKCFWRDSARATACLHCKVNKKTCVGGVGKEASEAGPSKKRRVTKGKGKEKEKEKSESESDAISALWEAIRDLKEETREVKEETRGVKEAVEGLREEFHALGTSDEQSSRCSRASTATSGSLQSRWIR
jgi:hypothetical protein